MKTSRLKCEAKLTEGGTRTEAATSKSWAVMRLVAPLACFAGTMLLQGCASAPDQRTLYPSPHFSPIGTNIPTISIATWNLKGLVDSDGLARTFKVFDFVSIWILTEVVIPLDSSTPVGVPIEIREPLVGILPPGQWHISYMPMNPVNASRTMWEGQAIASRYPIPNPQMWPLCATGTKKRRAALACEVLVGNQAILVVNTDHEVGWPSIGPEDRQQQVHDLIHHIAENPAAQSNPVILAGDFNTMGKPLHLWYRSSRAEIIHLQNSLAKIGLHPLPGPKAPYTTFRRYGLYRRALDHIFLRDADCCCWGSARRDRGSDHRPLWVTIRTDWNTAGKP